MVRSNPESESRSLEQWRKACREQIRKTPRGWVKNSQIAQEELTIADAKIPLYPVPASCILQALESTESVAEVQLHGHALFRVERSAVLPEVAGNQIDWDDFLDVELKQSKTDGIFRLYRSKCEVQATFPNCKLSSKSMSFTGISNLEHFFESRLLSSSGKSGKCLSTSASNPQKRVRLGFPVTSISSSHDQWPATKTQSFHLNTSRAYWSVEGPTFSTLHYKRFALHSLNMLYEGAPKVWLIVNPADKDKLEYRLCEAFGLGPEYDGSRLCAQFVRHLDIILMPSLLRSWNISFSMRLQAKGDMVFSLPYTYHQVINLGPSLAEIVNITTDRSWKPPVLYQDCSEACCEDIGTRRPETAIQSNQNSPRSTSTAETGVRESMRHRPVKSGNTAKQSSEPKSGNGSTRKRQAVRHFGPNKRRLAQMPTTGHTRKGEKIVEDSSDPESPENSAVGLPENRVANSRISSPAASDHHGGTADPSQPVDSGSSGRSVSSIDLDPPKPDLQRAGPATVTVDGSVTATAAQSASRGKDKSLPTPSTIAPPTSPRTTANNDAGQASLQLPEMAPVSEAAWSARIDERISWAIDHHEEFEWPSGSPATRAELEHDLRRFSPQKGKASWLSDKSMMELLGLFARNCKNLVIVDSLLVKTICQAGNTDQIPGLERPDMTVIAPHCSRNHWALIVVVPGESRIRTQILDRNVNRALGNAVNRTLNIQREYHQDFTSQAPRDVSEDSTNCAIWTLRAAQALCAFGRLSEDPLELRFMYLEMILHPTVARVDVAQALEHCGSQSKQGLGKCEWAAVPRDAKRYLPLPNSGDLLTDTHSGSNSQNSEAIDNVQSVPLQNCLQFDESLGKSSGWRDMLMSGQREYSLSLDRTYRILRLISGIACPAVFQQIRESLDSIHEPPEIKVTDSMTARAMKIFRKGELDTVHGVIKQRIGAYYIAEQFRRLVVVWQHRLKENHNGRRNASKRQKRKAPGNSDDVPDQVLPVKEPHGVTARAHAFDEFMAEWGKQSDSPSGRPDRENRIELERVIKYGRSWVNWVFGSRVGILCLIPALDILCPLDRAKSKIQPSKYNGADAPKSQAEILFYTHALGCLRPKVAIYCGFTEQLFRILDPAELQPRGGKLVIEQLSPVQVGEHSFDSQYFDGCLATDTAC